MSESMSIGKIGNYYGGLYMEERDGKYYWWIDNYKTPNEEEITKELYDALLKFENDSRTI